MQKFARYAVLAVKSESEVLAVTRL